MRKITFTGLSLLLVMMCLPADSFSQNRFDALRFSTQVPAADASSIGFGGATHSVFLDYGSALSNPAVLSLAPNSSFSVGLGLRDVGEDAIYLNQRRSYDDSQTSFTNAGFVYRFPTVQGSLVIGAGYNQTADFNRAYRISGFNSTSSITDFFLTNDFYFDTAFDAFAVDIDDDGAYSVLRNFTDEPFVGIDQTANVVERGHMGEFSFSAATEFVEGLHMGVTLGIPFGTYSYRRDFLETDSQNLHTGEPGSLTLDVNNIFNRDTIDADISGFSARAGVLYTAIPNISLGLSYQMPTRYTIDESYSVLIETTFDDGDFFDAELRGDNSYKVRTASRLSFGASTRDLPVDLSAAIERVGYSSLEFRELGNLAMEVAENDRIRDDFKDVYNLSFGAQLNISDVVQPRLGYAYLPSASRSRDLDRQYLSAGLRLGVSQDVSVDIALQYGFWDDEQVLYEYPDYPSGQSFNQSRVSTSVDRFHAAVGFSLRF